MKPSDLAVALDLQAAATRAIRASLLEGERKYGVGSLSEGSGTLSPRECLHRIAAHVDAALAGDTTEDHIGHILVRCAMLKYAQASVETTYEETQDPEGYTDTPGVSRSPLPPQPPRIEDAPTVTLSLGPDGMRIVDFPDAEAESGE